MINEEQFSNNIKMLRNTLLPSIDVYVDKTLKEIMHQDPNILSIDKILSQVSQIICDLRVKLWNDFRNKEKQLNQEALTMLALDYTPVIISDRLQEIITYNLINMFEQNETNIYQLFLSNTQSRRSRAGKEFECILAGLLKVLNIPIVTQAKLNKKPVDILIPNIQQYHVDPQQCLFLSAKTTLRERWQEVVEEKIAIKADKVFLCTLDSIFSDELIKKLAANNIVLVILQQDCQKYKEYGNIISFEELFQYCYKFIHDHTN